MAVATPMNRLLDNLRQALLVQERSAATDAELLERFVGHRDDSALEVLISRHATMVWGVCRRVLSQEHDAEDAFQATFLVLVRRAASIHPKGMVGNWLYGVAHQTALNARATAGKRRGRERQVTDMPEVPVADRPTVTDLHSVLDEELAALPDMHRAVIVLCDVEGKSRGEAARQLDLAEGTVASRLARARAALAKKLAGRGVSLSVGAMAVVTGQSAAAAGVPPTVLATTIKAAALAAAGQSTAGVASASAAALADTMVQAALVSKLKVALAGLLVIGVAGVIGIATAAAQRSSPDTAAESAGFAPKGVAVEHEGATTDKKRLAGQWKASKVVVNGEAVEFAAGDGPVYSFANDKLKVMQAAGRIDGKVGPAFPSGQVGGPGGPLGGLNPESRLKLMTQFGGRGGPWAGLNQDQRKLLLDHMKASEEGGVGVEFGFRLDEPAKSIDRFLTVDGEERLVVRGVYAVAGDDLQIWEGPPMGSRPTAQEIAAGTDCSMWSLRRVGP